MLMMAMCLGMFACGNSNAKSNKATEEQPQKGSCGSSLFSRQTALRYLYGDRKECQRSGRSTICR